MNRDPYLTQGKICEVWNTDKNKRKVMYFWGEHAGALYFCSQYSDLHVSDFQIRFKNYRPTGTEWNFAPIKKTYGWDAVCSTVDICGELTFWNRYEIETCHVSWYDIEYKANFLNCGICPDKTRYEGDAWKTSLRMRPEWAKVV